jgi:hypothetical protein
MANVLTYDPTPAEAEEFSEEEKDSLAVGEKLEEQQETLLADKFKNAEELEKAYIELQQKLGSNETPEETEAQEVSKEDTETSEENPSITLITDASAEYTEKGELSSETLDKFNEMSSHDLVQAYLELQQQQPKQEEVADLSDSDINNIKNEVGGEEAYSQLISWAGENLSKDQVAGFDSLIESGNTYAIQLAVSGLKAQYDNANGYEGRMLSGKAAQTSADVFRSQAEVVKAMSDPQYEKDPAYRQDIYEKLERSNIQF